MTYPWQSALARLGAAVLVVGCLHSTRALVLDQWRDLPRVHRVIEARNECSQTQKRHHSASDSLVYPWQSALARLGATVIVVGCTHPTRALVLHQCSDLRRVHGVLEARNEGSKTQKSTILPLTRSCTPGNLSLRASPLPSWRSAARTRPVCSSWTSTAIYAGCPE